MRFNFKKIAAIGASILLTGMTAGLASAALYPAPFVQNGTANVAIVYGTGAGVSPLDVVQAGNIQTNLQSYLGSGSGSTVVVSGNAEALDQGGANKIWLNTSLTNAKSIYTSTDFPTLLGSTTFSGANTATITQYITMGVGNTGTGTNMDNANKVIFDRLPTPSSDPAFGLNLGVGNASNMFYNETLTFSQPINFTASQNQGQTITLFGQQYTISSLSSSSTGIVLFGSAQTVNLAQGNSTTVTVNGVSHTITLGAVSSTQVQVNVDGTQGTINSGSTQQINTATGLVNIGVTSVFPSSGVSQGSATILVGANQLTFQSGSSVQVGTSNSPILGTTVYIPGGVNASQGLTIAVQAPTTLNATLLKGQSFVDPVFGTFQITNAGLSIPANITGTSPRDVMKVGTSGTTAMTLTFTDLNNNTNSVLWANNASGNFNLSTNTGYPIYPYEGANLSIYGETLTGTGSSAQSDGHLLELYLVYNSSGSSSTYTSTGYLNDYVQYLDVMSGQTYKTLTPTAIGVAPILIDGKQYTVYFGAPSGSTGWAMLKYPTSDSAANTGFVVYPTISTQQSGELGLYQPLALNLTNWSGSWNGSTSYTLNFPNSNGFSALTLTYNGAVSGGTNWTLSGLSATPTTISTNGTGSNYANISVAQLKYNFSITPGGAAGANITNITLYSPVTGGTTSITNASGIPLMNPAVVLYEGKDVNSAYNEVVIPTSYSSSAIGVTTPLMTANTQFSQSYVSNTNWIGYADYFGTLIIKDSTTSAQPVATIYYPANQVYEQLYLGPISSSVTSGSSGSALQLGQVLVKDSQVSSVMADNLIVVGGSCINSAAATLVGGAYCGSAWTTATGVGSGQFLIESYNSTINNNGLIALLVAGYDSPDTQNAATYLTTQKPDMTMNNKFVGTTSTSAQLTVV